MEVSFGAMEGFAPRYRPPFEAPLTKRAFLSFGADSNPTCLTNPSRRNIIT